MGLERNSIIRTLVAVGIMLAVNVFAGMAMSGDLETAPSDGRSLHWERFDVTLNNFDTAANRFEVTESYVIAVETGPFSYGFADIPMGRLDDITNVTVSEGSTALTSSCYGSAGTYCVTREDDTLSIQYYFTSRVQSSQQRSIRIHYTVHGALRSYDEGDELFWVALPGDLSFPVRASKVTVSLPESITPLRWTSYPDTWAETHQANHLIWDSPPNPSREGTFEVRVKYPHNPAMKEPGWQNTYDLEQKYKDNFRPQVTLLLGALGLAIAIGGSLSVVIRYLNHGRDPDTVVVPEYLSELPGDERPGIVGLLLDETADMKDIMATFVDLAQRGYFVIEQTEESSLGGLFQNTEFEFHRTDKEWTDLRGYETALLRGLFPNREHTKLDQLKTKFYTAIPGIKKQMYNELVQGGYFPRSPETTRNIWIGAGIGGMIVASLLFWAGLKASLISWACIVPPIGIGIVGAVALLFANAMPAKTAKGAQQAALWRAFRRYLADIDKRKDIETAVRGFDQFFAYATAFGIEKDFMRRVAPALTQMPGWYFPTHMGGPWHGGYRTWRTGPTSHPTSRAGGAPGGATPDFGGSFGAGGLESMNRSLTEGLNSMSRGMTQMLNEASRAMTSKPQSSGSGGRGGGFSGGGRGGGSGGGSRGFG